MSSNFSSKADFVEGTGAVEQTAEPAPSPAPEPAPAQPTEPPPPEAPVDSA